MPRSLRAGRSKPQFEQVLLAVLLGVTAGLFVGGYWLTDLFPADSRLLIAFTSLAGAAAAVAYYAGALQLASALRRVAARQALHVILLGAPLAGFLFFAGTSQWQNPGRYIGFLLPRQEFVLTSDGAPAGTTIDWMSTSLGDISYDSLEYAGWSRRGDQMVLDDPRNNSMSWRGKMGERLEIVFAAHGAGGDFRIRWNNGEERIRVGSGKSSYQRTVEIPFVASSSCVLALGLMHFWLLTATVLLAASSGGRVWHPATATGNSEGARRELHRELPALAAIMGLALLLRLFNLGAVFPAVDEYYHLIAADQLLGGAPLGSVYPRGLWIVTLPVAAALRLLGHEVWAARSIGVVFNVMAIVPLYLLVRKLSAPAAIGASLLYATSPWIITFARMAREYAYYPLYFYLIALAMVSLVEAIPLSFVARRQWRALLRPGIVLLALALLVPPLFALRIDWLSTFRTILIAYLVFGAFVLMRFDWRARDNWPFLVAAALGLAACGWFFYREQLTKLLLLPRINAVPLSYFFPNPRQQWYYGRMTIVMAIALAAAVTIAIKSPRVGVMPLFIACLYAAYLTVFVLFSKTFFHTRHLISTQFWFVPLAGIGLSWLWEWLRGIIAWKGRVTGAMLALALAAMLLNPSQILLPTLSREPDMPISEDYLHDMSQVQAYMLSHVRPGDALVSTVYGLYAIWEGAPAFAEKYRINSGTTLEELMPIVRAHEAGWIVIDAIRLDMSAISERSLTSMPQMEYIGSFGDEHVWRWGWPLAGSPASDL